MTDLPEAAFVVFTEMTDEDGWVWHPTLRKGATAADIEGAFKAIQAFKAQAVKYGFKPYVKKSSFGTGAKAPIEYYNARICPQDAGRLIKKTSKEGKPFLVCENGKYDALTKTRSGCKFFEFLII